MQTGFPCPNPTCAHVFPPQAVTGAASLTCPRCGSVFQFRPGGAPPSPRPAPTVKPPLAAPPPVVPVAPKVVPVAPVASPPVPIAVPVQGGFDPTLAPPADFTSPRLSRVSRRRKPSPYPPWLFPGIGVGIGAVLVACLLGLYWAGWLGRSGGGPAPGFEPGDIHESKLYNYDFALPSRTWKVDDPIRLDLKAVLGLRRYEPSSWMALLVHKSDKRTMPEAELLDAGIRRLNTAFDRMEWEPRTEVRRGDRTEQVKLDGKTALRVVFQGGFKEVAVTGECYMIAQHGISYWLVTWSPQEDATTVAEEWALLRDGFRLRKDRDGWTEPKPALIAAGVPEVGLGLKYTEKLWDKENAANYDPDARLALLGRDQTDPDETPRDGARTASVVVLQLPKADDLKGAVTVAREHLEKRQKELYPMTTIEEATDMKAKPEDRPPEEIGDTRGRVLRLHVINGEGRERLVYLAVVQQPEQTLVIQCECDWKRRPYWEVNFVQLLRTFQFRKMKS